jgi:hypothetical protein
MPSVHPIANREGGNLSHRWGDFPFTRVAKVKTSSGDKEKMGMVCLRDHGSQCTAQDCSGVVCPR